MALPSRLSTPMISDASLKAIAALAPFAEGDLLTFDATGEPVKLAKGAAGQMLRRNLAGDGYEFAAETGVPAGQVSWFARDTAPTGWLKCNGSNASRTTFAALFDAIGTAFGAGDGSTTFGLPDLRGEFIRGWDDGRGVDAARVLGSAQSQAIQAHTHSGTTTGGEAGAAGASFTARTGSSGNTGSTGGTETRPRNVALLACIKF